MIDQPSSIAFPPSLPHEGTIGLVAPSRCPDKTYVDALQKALRNRGHNLVIASQVWAQDGRYAGRENIRAQAIMDMFLNPDISAIMCARGGSDAIRLLDLLDYDLIAKNPKPFIGYSDVTLLLHAIAKKAGFVTYHGPMAVNFAEDKHDLRTETDLFEVIDEREGQRHLIISDLDVVTEGVAKGRLWGGNLSLLQCLIGTDYDWSSEDSILFIEEVGEYLYEIDRMMAHLKLAGKFKGLRAVIVGETLPKTDCDPVTDPGETVPYTRSLKDIVLEHIPQDIPVVFGYPCGHGKYTTTLPLGADVQLTLASGKATLDFGP